MLCIYNKHTYILRPNRIKTSETNKLLSFVYKNLLTWRRLNRLTKMMIGN